jgi:hypothetical protein
MANIVSHVSKPSDCLIEGPPLDFDTALASLGPGQNGIAVLRSYPATGRIALDRRVRASLEKAPVEMLIYRISRPVSGASQHQK